MESRLGIGYDLHRLVEGRKLFIGGVVIPYIKGLYGHSDADVLIHAICDALLGAIGEPDIGELFPDTDPKYQGIASTELLKIVLKLVREKGYKMVNLDAIVIAEEPKLSAFKNSIKNSLSGLLGLSNDRIGIKAKTNEGLGEIGKKEAVACFASVLLNREV